MKTFIEFWKELFTGDKIEDTSKYAKSVTKKYLFGCTDLEYYIGFSYDNSAIISTDYNDWYKVNIEYKDKSLAKDKYYNYKLDYIKSKFDGLSDLISINKIFGKVHIECNPIYLMCNPDLYIDMDSDESEINNKIKQYKSMIKSDLERVRSDINGYIELL